MPECIQLFVIHPAKMEPHAHKIFDATVPLVGREKYVMKVYIYIPIIIIMHAHSLKNIITLYSCLPTTM